MRLQQVLINLGGNAVKFTSTGQVVLFLRKRSQTDSTVTIEFAVQDTGIGIAPEHLGHIFSGFSQAEGSTTRRFGGTGLGLAISQRLVALMGGEIQLSSQPGVGSTFAFSIEFPTQVEGAHGMGDALPPILKSARALIVDDNPIAGDLTQRMARSFGWSVDLAKSGREAVDMVSAQLMPPATAFPYSVIFMDWNMPEMDGWEATRQIRALADKRQLDPPKVVMVTAHGRETLAHRTEDEQGLINGFLVKPVTAAMLYEAWMEAGRGNTSVKKLGHGRSSKRQLEGLRVLVVEDNMINQQVADELLSAEGAIVSLAANGQLGVDAVAAAAPQFDVVLMDLQMPVLDGYGATRLIRENLELKDLPIVAMTANAMASDRDACLAAGMNEHIGKPFDMAKLVSLLIRLTGFQSEAEAAGAPVVEQAPHKVPVVVGLEIEAALNRMSGLRSLYVRTARHFVKVMDDIPVELRQCLATEDKQRAVRCLHTLKGNAGTLGATELAAMAGTLEKLCSSGEGMKTCAEKLDLLEALIRRTQAQMTEAITRLNSETVAPATITTERRSPAVGVLAWDALQSIADLAKAADMAVLMEFSESRERLEGLPAEFLERLEEALQNLDLESVAAMCDEVLLQRETGNR
jgi:CheY-like chemotaxis protein